MAITLLDEHHQPRCNACMRAAEGVCPHHGLLAAAACSGNRWVTRSQGRPLMHAQLCLQVSVETALEITYQPQAVFRVRPVSRCTASMPGERMCSKNTCPILQLKLCKHSRTGIAT